MVTVQVGPETLGPFELDAIPEADINRAVNRRVDDGAEPCVRVRIEERPLALRLRTRSCPSGGDGSSDLTEQASAIKDLWEDLVFERPQLEGGHVNGFLKQVRRLL